MMSYRRFSGSLLQSEYLEKTRSNRATEVEACHVFTTRSLKGASFPNCIFFKRLSERASGCSMEGIWITLGVGTQDRIIH
jgi:hypothetical protein